MHHPKSLFDYDREDYHHGIGIDEEAVAILRAAAERWWAHAHSIFRHAFVLRLFIPLG